MKKCPNCLANNYDVQKYCTLCARNLEDVPIREDEDLERKTDKYFASKQKAPRKVAPAKCLDVLKEVDEYLSSNPLNSVGSGSILHRKVKEAIYQSPHT